MLKDFIRVILTAFLIASAVGGDALALDKKASLPLTHYIMALLYDDLGEEDLAVKEYEEVLKLDNETALVHLNFAATLIKNNEVNRARDELNYSVKLDPEAIEPHVILTLLNFSQGKFDLAAKEYETALKNATKLDPKNDDPEAHFYLGTVYAELKNNVLLEKELRKAIALKPDYAEALNFLGYTYVEDNKNLKEAEDLIRRALKVDPDNGAYIDSLGWLYYRKGRFKEAKETLKKAASLMQDAVIFDHLGDVFFKIKDINNARLNWQESLRLNPRQENVKKKIEALKNK